MEIKVLASGSSGNCYWISDGMSQLLLDAGIRAKSIKEMLGYKLHDVDAALITHEHGDHIKAAADLAAAGVDVYASKGTIEAYFEGAASRARAKHRWHEAKVMEPLLIASFTVFPFDVKHDAAEPLGYMIYSHETGERLLYFTDTYYIKYRFTGLNYIMGECNYDKNLIYRNIEDGTLSEELAPRLMKSHMSLDQFTEILKANDLSKIKQIYLLHLSDTNSNAEYFKGKIQRLTGAEVYVC